MLYSHLPRDGGECEQDHRCVERPVATHTHTKSWEAIYISYIYYIISDVYILFFLYTHLSWYGGECEENHRCVERPVARR